MKPGRQSAAALAIAPIAPATPQQRHEPPPIITATEAALWRSIVESLPVDWFRPSDLPLLAAYCQAVTQHEAAGAELATSTLMLTSKGRHYRNPLIAIQHQAALRAAALAVKLRLCPSARYGPRAAATAATNTQAGRKPWQ